MDELENSKLARNALVAFALLVLVVVTIILIINFGERETILVCVNDHCKHKEVLRFP